MGTTTTTTEEPVRANSNGHRVMFEKEKEFEGKFLAATLLPRICISALWTLAIAYATYQLYLFNESNLLWQKDPVMNPGPWTKVLGRGRDTSDYEWYFFTASFITSGIFWFLSYVVLNRTVQIFLPEISPIFSIGFCFAYLNSLLGLWPTTFLALQPPLYWMLLRLRRKSAIWAATFLYLYFLNSSFCKVLVPTSYGIPQYYFSVTAAWNAARCISFSFDTWNRPGTTALTSLLSFMQYVFYFPIINNGPLVLFDKFEHHILLNPSKPQSWEATLADLRLLGRRIVRIAFWMAAVELLLHYLYFRPLSMTEVLLQRANWWALCGVIYWLGQFFQVKYVVMYGLTSAVAEFDGLEMPPLPKCIAYIHRYSALWKDFDRGLYNFLVRYTYVPTLEALDGIDKNKKIHKELRKLIASFSSFVYVYIWHSTSYQVFLWATFNFLGITLESTGRFVKNQVNINRRIPSAVWDVIVEPFATIPLAVMSVMNSVVFTGDLPTAEIVFQRFFTERSDHYVLHFLYLFTHTGVLVRSWPTAYAAFRGHHHAD